MQLILCTQASSNLSASNRETSRYVGSSLVVHSEPTHDMDEASEGGGAILMLVQLATARETESSEADGKKRERGGFGITPCYGIKVNQCSTR